MEETPNDIDFRQVKLTDPSPLLSKLHQTLTTCAKSLESDDFSPSNASLCDLIGFLDSISDSAPSDRNHIETAKTASLVLAELDRFVSSPSLSQMVVDALAFELPKAVVRFAGVSDECRGIVDSVVDHFVAVCNPRDMHSVLCEGGGTLGSASKENILGKCEISDNSGQDSFAQSKSEALQRDIRVDTSTHIELNPRRSISPNDMGKILTSQAPASSDRPFKEHQLKQLRAQCLVHLAFRNRLVPRKLHLDIALGESYPKEGCADGIHGSNDHSRAVPLKEPSDNQEITGMSARSSDTLKNEKEMPLTRISPGSSSTASLIERYVSSKDTEITKKMNKKGPQSNRSVVLEEKKPLLTLKREDGEKKSTYI